MSALHRDIGRLEGRVEAVEKGMAAMKEELGRFENKLDKIMEHVSALREDRASVKGGFWTANKIAAILFAGGGATLAWLATTFGGK